MQPISDIDPIDSDQCKNYS